jgi:hypothetical protein
MISPQDMPPDQDAVDTLARLRPVTVVENVWPAPARDAAFERVMQAARTPSRTSRNPRSSRWRLALAVVVTALLVGSGVSIAAAGGILPESFGHAFSFWKSETHGAVAARNARRVGQIPGPGREVLSLWVAAGKNGATCLSLLYEPPGPLGRPAPGRARSVGGECATARQREGRTFGGLSASSPDSRLYAMWGPMGEAARVELRLDDGSVRPAGSAAGYFFFWFRTDREPAPALVVGYDDAGQVVGRQAVPRLPMGPAQGASVKGKATQSVQ